MPGARRSTAEIVGYGATCDAYHITAPAPDGEGGARAMAHGSGGCAASQPEHIDYINAHGTSTPLNDKCETAAVKAAFGDHAYRLAISSTKSMTGPSAGCGGCQSRRLSPLLALRDGFIPRHHPLSRAR